MSWQQLSLTTTQEKLEAISDLLDELGAVSITCQSANDEAILEPAPGEVPLWSELKVITLFAEPCDTQKILSDLKASPLMDDCHNISIHQLEDQPWERAWMDDFHPIQCGKRLWVVPSWHNLDNDNAIQVHLDPGLAFGSGTHPTTFLCLEWLDAQNLTDKSLLDFGCGSGILGIAAAKLGAALVHAVDIDPQAIQASQENALRNQLNTQQFLCMPINDIKNRDYHVIIANILAAPIKEQSKFFTKLVSSHGDLVLSGILDHQADEVITYYADAFNIIDIAHKDEWVRIHCKKLK